MDNTEKIDGTPAKKEKDTVRKRKRNAKASTQRFVPIGEIHHDTVVLKNGGLRAVLQVEALNFHLKSEVEQQGIIAGYESFVNTLTFPVQIVIRSSKMNIDPYIVKLRALAEKQPNELLKHQTNSYANFVERIVDVADIMQKRFYVVVPLDSSAPKKSTFASFLGWFGNDDTSAKATARRKSFQKLSGPLRERVTLVQSGLTNIGLSAKRMNTSELITLYYNIYNPETSQEQKLADEGSLNLDPLVL